MEALYEEMWAIDVSAISGDHGGVSAAVLPEPDVLTGQELAADAQRRCPRTEIAQGERGC
jgi:hypothetical protein